MTYVLGTNKRVFYKALIVLFPKQGSREEVHILFPKQECTLAGSECVDRGLLGSQYSRDVPRCLSKMALPAPESVARGPPDFLKSSPPGFPWPLHVDAPSSSLRFQLQLPQLVVCLQSHYP